LPKLDYFTGLVPFFSVLAVVSGYRFVVRIPSLQTIQKSLPQMRLEVFDCVAVKRKTQTR